MKQQKVVHHLGGIFSEVKSLRSRAQGAKISRFAPGPGPKGPKENKSTNILKTTMTVLKTTMIMSKKMENRALVTVKKKMRRRRRTVAIMMAIVKKVKMTVATTVQLLKNQNRSRK